MDTVSQEITVLLLLILILFVLLSVPVALIFGPDNRDELRVWGIFTIFVTVIGFIALMSEQLIL